MRTWAAQYFVRTNAALWLSGPVPDGLRLPLPDGSAPPRQPLHLRGVRTPSWSTSGVDGHVAVGAHLPRSAGLTAALHLLADRVEDELRLRRGLTYTVESDHLPVSGAVGLTYVSADVRYGREEAAAHVLWRTLERLADDRPTAEELDHRRAVVEERLAAPDTLTAYRPQRRHGTRHGPALPRRGHGPAADR